MGAPARLRPCARSFAWLEWLAGRLAGWLAGGRTVLVADGVLARMRIRSDTATRSRSVTKGTTRRITRYSTERPKTSPETKLKSKQNTQQKLNQRVIGCLLPAPQSNITNFNARRSREE
uniref:Putative secreted protein n=1 Tax=Anopheles marajoara TaxID=58244 RepID=A0A2M4C7E9_9DIPT